MPELPRRWVARPSLVIFLGAWALSLASTQVHALKTYNLKPGDGQLFADAVAYFGSTGDDTTILLPRGKMLSLLNVTLVSAQPAPGYVPFSAGTLIIKPGPDDGTAPSTAPTILDAGMRWRMNYVWNNGTGIFTQTAKLFVYDLTIINNCDWEVLLEEKPTQLIVNTGVAPSFMMSGTIYQAFQFYNCTFYTRQADIAIWYNTYSLVASPFTQITDLLPKSSNSVNLRFAPQLVSMYSVSMTVASFPGVAYFNTTTKATVNPSDPFLQQLKSQNLIMPHQTCIPRPDPQPAPMVDPLSPHWLTADTASWLDALNQATNNFYFGAAYGIPMTISLLGIAMPGSDPNPPLIAPLTKTLVVSGPPLREGPYATDGIVDLRLLTRPIMPVAAAGKLFLQYLVLRNLPTRPLNTSGTPSVFPLSSFPITSATNVIQVYNVTLELPDLDYLALMTLAQPDLAAQVNATVQAHAAALKGGIGALTGPSVSPAMTSILFKNFTGWGLNATNLNLLPAQPSVPAAIALRLAAASQPTSAPVASSPQDSGKQFSGKQLGGAVAGAIVGTLLLSGLLIWVLVAAGALRVADKNKAQATSASRDKASPDAKTAQLSSDSPSESPTSASSRQGSPPGDSTTSSNRTGPSPPAVVAPLSKAAGQSSDDGAANPDEDRPASLLEIVSRLTNGLNQSSVTRERLHARHIQALEAFCSDNASMLVNKPAEASPNASVDQVTLVLTPPHATTPGSSNQPQQQAAASHEPPAGQQQPSSTEAPSVTITITEGESTLTPPDSASRYPATNSPETGSSAADHFVRKETGASSKGSKESDPKATVGQLMEELQGDMNKVDVDGILGQGSSGTVYSGRWRGLEVALKTTLFEVHNRRGSDNSGGQYTSDEDRAMFEVAVAASVDHPNVVRTYYYDIQPVRATTGAAQHGLEIDERHADKDTPLAYKVFLIQERCASSLSDVFQSQTLHDHRGRVQQMDVLLLLLDIAKGLEYLHGRNIVHGDLKPANVLLAPGADPASITAKLADFGLSARLGVDATHVSNFRSGTPFYVAPEVVHEHRTSPASDVFSFGVIMWQLHTGEAPYTVTPQDTFAWNPIFPNYLTDNPPIGIYAALVDRCLRREPKERPSAPELIKVLDTLITGQAAGTQNVA